MELVISMARLVSINKQIPGGGKSGTRMTLVISRVKQLHSVVASQLISTKNPPCQKNLILVILRLELVKPVLVLILCQLLQSPRKMIFVISKVERNLTLAVWMLHQSWSPSNHNSHKRQPKDLEISKSEENCRPKP